MSDLVGRIAGVLLPTLPGLQQFLDACGRNQPEIRGKAARDQYIGLMRLPGVYFLLLGLILVSYCALTGLVKSWFGRKYEYY